MLTLITVFQKIAMLKVLPCVWVPAGQPNIDEMLDSLAFNFSRDNHQSLKDPAKLRNHSI